MTDPKPSISVVVPVYFAERTLIPLVEQLHAFLNALRQAFFTCKALNRVHISHLHFLLELRQVVPESLLMLMLGRRSRAASRRHPSCASSTKV